MTRGMIDLDQPIVGAPNFSWRELVRTSHRDYLGPNSMVPLALKGPGTALAQMLQAVRGHYVRPLVVHSGYRCEPLNRAIGGSKTSQHMAFEAADFHVSGKSLGEVWEWIVGESGIPYGQCLLEGYAAGSASWIHLSLGEPWHHFAPGRRAGRSEDGGKTFTWYR